MFAYHLQLALRLLDSGQVFNVTFMEGQPVMMETTEDGHAVTIEVLEYMQRNRENFNAAEWAFAQGEERIVRREGMVELASMITPSWAEIIGAKPLHGTLRMPGCNPMRCSFFLFTNEAHAPDTDTSHAKRITPPEEQRLASGYSGRLGCAVRILPKAPMTLDALRINQLTRSVADAKGGLVLITGSPGVGKSTTAAAFIEHVNRTRSGTIVTAESPVEVPFVSKSSVVTQREVGVNVVSVSVALRDAERNFAHSALVGEIQTQQDQLDTFNAARHGMFVVTTAFSSRAAEAVKMLVTDLDRDGVDGADLVSSTLQAVIHQVRLPSLSAGRWAFAYESIVVSGQKEIAALVRARDWIGLQETVTKDDSASMNGSLAALVRSKAVLLESAMAHAYDKSGLSALVGRA